MSCDNGFKCLITFAALLIIVVGIISSTAIIPTGYTGVKSTLGQIDNATIGSGIVFHLPIIQHIEKINNKQQEKLFVGRIFAETNNRTTIYFDDVTVTYQISSDKSAWILANVADYENAILTQATISSAVKSASKTLEDIDATNRAKIEPLAQKELQAILDSKYGEDTIYVNRVTLANIEFEERYNDAIAAKQAAQLAYEKAAIENQQAIEKAEAEAEVKRMTAQGDADAMKIKADAEAEANKVIAQSLSKEILDNKYYEKWNGELPHVVGDASVLIVPE